MTIEEAKNAIKKLSDRLNKAEQCICDIEDALDKGNDNDWAREAIKKYMN